MFATQRKIELDGSGRFVKPSRTAGAGRALQTLDVEALLVWTYRDQCAHRAEDYAAASVARATRTGGGWSTDGCVAVGRYAELGTFVDRSIDLGFDLQPDAEATHAVVLALGRDEALLLLQYATIAGRPSWRSTPARVLPQWKGGEGIVEGGRIARGRCEMIYDGNRHAIACRVELVGDRAQQVEARRARYALWHGALAEVAARLRRRGLRDHLVTGPAAPAEPWSMKPIDSAKNA